MIGLDHITHQPSLCIRVLYTMHDVSHISLFTSIRAAAGTGRHLFFSLKVFLSFFFFFVERTRSVLVMMVVAVMMMFTLYSWEREICSVTRHLPLTPHTPTSIPILSLYLPSHLYVCVCVCFLTCLFTKHWDSVHHTSLAVWAEICHSFSSCCWFCSITISHRILLHIQAGRQGNEM